MESTTIILVDGTGSMQKVFQQLILTITVMLENLKKVLVEQKLPENIFQIQFAVFRNYSQKEDEIL